MDTDQQTAPKTRRKVRQDAKPLALKDGEPVTRKTHSHPDPILGNAVATMALAGFPVKQIAAALKISLQTINDHYSYELEHGRTNIMAEVVGSLAQRAVAGSDTAAIWLTKTRLGWSEKSQLDINANIEMTVQRNELMSELAGLITKGITIDAEPETPPESK